MSAYSYAEAAPRLRGVFAGSGADALGETSVCNEIIRLAGKPQPCVLYLGTATYDVEAARVRQTQRFIDAGCTVVPLNCAHARPSDVEIDAAFEAADVVVVSGGNTLFAVDRWHYLGIARRLREHATRLVLAGGSAGAICWFDSGHSDSSDPTTFRHPPAAVSSVTVTSAETPETAAAAAASAAPTAAWQYIRIDGLGLLPGLLCPHHDKTQSNGVLRAHDLDAMLVGVAPNERAVCIDHWAALVIENGTYKVLAVPGQPGSVGEGADVSAAPLFLADRTGRPGVWIKECETRGDASAAGVNDHGCVRRWLAPASGSLDALLRAPHGGGGNVDARVAAVRAVNSAEF